MGVSTDLVPPGYLQFEGGWTSYREHGGGDRARTLSYGSPLLRLGVSKHLELRVEGDGYQTLETGYGHEPAHGSGWSDIAVGAKVRIAEQHGWVPGLVLLPMISLPSGGDEFTSDSYEPSLNLGWVRKIPAGIQLGGAFGMACTRGDMGRYWPSTVVVTAAHDLAAGWNGYVETQRVSAIDRGKPGEWMADAGVSRMVAKAAQIDVQIGHTVGGCRSAWFASVGIALRAPKPLFR